MSTRVIGFIAADDDYKRKARAWKMCKEAGVAPPPELVTLFDGQEPQEAGIEVAIEVAVREWNTDYASGFEIDVSKLPQGVRILRFYNSW